MPPAPHVQAPPPPPVVAPALPGALTTPAPLPVGERLAHGITLTCGVWTLWNVLGGLGALLWQPAWLDVRAGLLYLLAGGIPSLTVSVYWFLLPLRHERQVLAWQQTIWGAQLDDAQAANATQRDLATAYGDYWLHAKPAAAEPPAPTVRYWWQSDSPKARVQTVAAPNPQPPTPKGEETRPLPALLTTPPPWQLTLWAIVEGVRGRAVSERNLPPTVSKATYQEALARLHAAGVVDTPRNKPPRLAAAWTRYTDDPAAADMQVARLLEG